nr:aldolase/citrate lyase family protein [uncultured Oscillibacter sp.]
MESVAQFRAALESDQGALGLFMLGTDPAFVEAAGHAGYDFVLLDMEHGTTTFETLPHLIRAANVAGVSPVVRVPRGTDIWIDQALDVGAGAVMVPQIDTAGQARAAVSAAKFSPLGTRGTNRFVRSAGFGAVPSSEYFSKAQDTVLILQVEGQKAVENLDEILDVPGVDVVFVGPYDLSSSLGHVGEIDHPEVTACIKGIIAKGKEKGIKIGCFADTVESGKRWRDLGVKFVGYSCDTYLFYQKAAEDVASFALDR